MTRDQCRLRILPFIMCLGMAALILYSPTERLLCFCQIAVYSVHDLASAERTGFRRRILFNLRLSEPWRRICVIRSYWFSLRKGVPKLHGRLGRRGAKMWLAFCSYFLPASNYDVVVFLNLCSSRDTPCTSHSQAL